MYQPSRLLGTFHIAGFKFHEGYTVLDQLHAGVLLEIAPETDNPHDEFATALSFDGTMLGYVPRSENAVVGPMCRFGHAAAFEARVIQVDRDAAPWEQVLVGLYVRDVTARQ